MQVFSAGSVKTQPVGTCRNSGKPSHPQVPIGEESPGSGGSVPPFPVVPRRPEQSRAGGPLRTQTQQTQPAACPGAGVGGGGGGAGVSDVTAASGRVSVRDCCVSVTPPQRSPECGNEQKRCAVDRMMLTF